MVFHRDPFPKKAICPAAFALQDALSLLLIVNIKEHLDIIAIPQGRVQAVGAFDDI